MSDNIRSIVHHIVRTSIDSVSDMEDKLFRALQIVERASKESCCLCRDKCLSCDAQDLLKELKNDECVSKDIRDRIKTD